MKNIKKLVCSIGILGVLFLLFFRVDGPFLILGILKLFGAGDGHYNLKPDDRISSAVYDAVGEDMDYHGKEEAGDEVTYRYELMNNDAETIAEFVNAINNSLDEKQKKISVYVSVEAEIPSVWTDVLGLFNYSDSNLEKADYDGFCSLYINDYLDHWDSMFLEPLTYTGIEGIRRLEIGIQMQQRADEDGINWYECWPDLEEVIFTDDITHEVYDAVGGDYFYFFRENDNEYSYQLKQTDAEAMSKFVKAVNSVLEDEQEQEQILLRVFVGIPDKRTDVYPDGQRLEEVFALSNCSDNKDCDGLCSLEIFDPFPDEMAESDEQFFPDPAVYTGIEGIKNLRIGFTMQQRAEKEGIDWYECLPDLEKVTFEEPYTLETR